MVESKANKGTFGSQPYRYTTPFWPQPEIQSVWFFAEGGKQESPEKNPCVTGENQCTILLTYGLSQGSNLGHSGERQALYALATHATPHAIIYDNICGHHDNVFRVVGSTVTVDLSSLSCVIFECLVNRRVCLNMLSILQITQTEILLLYYIHRISRHKGKGHVM